MTAFEFVDELPRKKSSSATKTDPLLNAFSEALRANPKQWAKWPKPQTKNAGATTAYAINAVRHPAPVSLRTGEFEATSRDGVCYVRYVGAA